MKVFWMPVVVGLVTFVVTFWWLRRSRRRRHHALAVRDAERMKLRALAAADYAQSVRRGPWQAS